MKTKALLVGLLCLGVGGALLGVGDWDGFAWLFVGVVALISALVLLLLPLLQKFLLPPSVRQPWTAQELDQAGEKERSC